MQKKLPKLSPGAAKVAGASLVALVAVGAIVLIAHQASPSVDAAQKAKAVTAPVAPPPAAPANATLAKGGKPANAGRSAQIQQPVTLTGCLEQNHDTFRLKDTAGAEAPKSRSWKTLGLTKHASSVTVVDSAKRLKLGTHVGERISVTGMLADNEMQGRTLKSVSPSCD